MLTIRKPAHIARQRNGLRTRIRLSMPNFVKIARGIRPSERKFIYKKNPNFDDLGSNSPTLFHRQSWNLARKSQPYEMSLKPDFTFICAGVCMGLWPPNPKSTARLRRNLAHWLLMVSHTWQMTSKRLCFRSTGSRFYRASAYWRAILI